MLDGPESSQYDIGNFTNLDNVTDEVKYNLPTNHLKLDSNYIFPAMFYDMEVTDPLIFIG